MPVATKSKNKKHSRKSRRKAKPVPISRTQKPDDMTLEQWQTALRRQFGREQEFKLENLGSDPVFSEFRVTNPASKGTYRVVIRGAGVGDNFCACRDFSTNTLGTCKHIEFTLARLSRSRDNRARLGQPFEPDFSEVVLRYGARREVRFLPAANCPRGLIDLAAEYFDASCALRPGAVGRFEKFIADASRFDHELKCNDDVLAYIAEVRDAESRRQRIDRAFPQGIRSKGFDNLVNAELYDYQRQGILFAARAGRCLIGDEMGLGKTLQAIAAAQVMATHLGINRVLIICPTSLKHQWEREISRFTKLSAVVINGLRPRREELFKADSFFKITNYDTVHRDLDLIEGLSPDLVILDEAQRIKNWKTRAARTVKRIVSPYAIVLTGTPLENRLEELVSIVEFIDAHRLGPMFRFLDEHQLLDDVGKVVGYRNLDTIGKTLEPVLIRRRKSQVLTQLPERLDKNFFVAMTPEQFRHHDENRDLVAQIVAKWRRMKFLTEADQRKLMIGLQNMRMSCNSTYLLDQETDFGVKADELATLLDELFEQPDTKVVVFSQWVRTHELIQRRLKNKPFDHVLFHGGVPGTQRKALIDRFRDDPKCRLFLSTDAGGVGLNLQHASVVANMDLPWNPAVLEQRIGRVHRMGQKRPVQVINFVSQGTIEEGMLSLLKFKKSLFTGALDGGEKEVFLGGNRLSRFMDTVDKATSSIPTPPPAEPEPIVEPAYAASAADFFGNIQSDESGAPGPKPQGASPDAMWAGLLQTGVTLLNQLTGKSDGGAVLNRAASVIRQDAQSGKPYLHIPAPSPETLNKILEVAGELIQRLRSSQ